MNDSTKQFTYKTVQAFSDLLGIARERLAAGVTHVEADDLADAASELHAAAALARQAADASTGFAGMLLAEVNGVRP